jgi:hypothetical protein
MFIFGGFGVGTPVSGIWGEEGRMEIGVWRNWSVDEAGNVDENGELGAVGENWWAYPWGMANYTAINIISKFNITFNLLTSTGRKCD